MPQNAHMGNARLATGICIMKRGLITARIVMIMSGLLENAITINYVKELQI